MPIIMIDGQRTIVLANAAAEKLLGYEATELAGQPVDVLVPERFRDGHAEHRIDFFATPAAQPMAARRDIYARRKDGIEIPIEVGLTRIQAREETLVLAAIVDLTERRELEHTQEELQHVSRVSTMGEIAASLAHELSQPLSAILNNAQAGLRLLENGRLDEAETAEILREVVAHDKRASEVIRALRTLLRRSRTEMEQVDVTNAVRSVLVLLHGELETAQVKVETALEDRCLVLANNTQIEQVVLNLVMNGIAALRPQAPAQRRLWIRTSHTARRDVEVAVGDCGVGIPEHELGKVFDAFWTTKPHGMGMGLAICRSIVRSYGGDIRVEPNDGSGVTFVFTLPDGTAGLAAR